VCSLLILTNGQYLGGYRGAFGGMPPANPFPIGLGMGGGGMGSIPEAPFSTGVGVPQAPFGMSTYGHRRRRFMLIWGWLSFSERWVS
jgi:hypothetical protein